VYGRRKLSTAYFLPFMCFLQHLYTSKQCYFSKEVGSGTHTMTQNLVGGLVFLSGTVQNVLVCYEEEW
jgi:hypothetical protein